MRRDTIAVVVIAICGVLALAVAGATITDLREEGDGGGSSDGDGPDVPEQPEPGDWEFDVIEVVPGELVMLVLLTIVALLVVTYVIRNWEEAMVYLVVGVLLVLGLLLLIHLLPWDPQSSPLEWELDMEDIDPGGGDGGGGGAETPSLIGDWFPVFLLIGGVAVVAVAVSVLATRDDPEKATPAPEESAEPSPELAADIGAAAGRAADRLEAETDRENEVYQAWVEMTELLDGSDPRSATPGAFARKARHAGIAADDVDDLTNLFEEVRYGDRPATESRERAAIQLLRRIEDRYATASDTPPEGAR